MKKKDKLAAKTQHSRVYDKEGTVRDPFVVMDSPDDRMTAQDGNGVTLVSEENPDDMETG